MESQIEKLNSLASTKYRLPEPFFCNLENFKSFEVRDSDIWINTFPKSGTTWVQELVYVMINGCDYGKKDAAKIDERVPFFEFPKPGLSVINKMESPRIIKTHLPKLFLPDNIENKCKIIYVARNPKDVCVSFYFFARMRKDAPFEGTFQEFMRLFMEGKTYYGPWWEHIDDFYETKNVHFLFYEDLQTKPLETIKALANYIGKSFSDDEIMNINSFCSFENMKANPNTNYHWYRGCEFKSEFVFFRKGQIGDWTNYFNGRESQEFDDVIETNLKNNLSFNYGLAKEDFENFFKCKEGSDVETRKIMLSA